MRRKIAKFWAACFTRTRHWSSPKLMPSDGEPVAFLGGA